MLMMCIWRHVWKTCIVAQLMMHLIEEDIKLLPASRKLVVDFMERK